MKRITASLLVLVLMFSASPATTTVAYNWPGGYWSGTAISDNVLDVCFADNTSPTFTNRAVILAGMNVWGQAVDIDFADQTDPGGLCLSSNIRVAWVAIGATCDPIARTSILPAEYGGTVDLEFNSNCAADFYWGSTGPVPNGKKDVYDIGAHEAGHALGLGHVDEVDVSTDVGASQVWFHFETLCSGTYKWDKYCVRPTGPKNTQGKIYSGSLDPGVGNYSSSPRPNLPAGNFRITFQIANESLSRNPNGVRLEIYQGTTLKYTSAFTSGLSIMTGAADLTWTAAADFRFRVQYSKAAIYDVRVFWHAEDGNQLMQPFTPHCLDATERVTLLSADDADGVRSIYPSHAISGAWPTDIDCS